MHNFTPYSALAGGILMGLSATLLLLLTGRIAGISGIVGGALSPSSTDRNWRLAFIAGLVLGAGAWLWIAPAAYAPRVGFPLVLVGLAGLLVGFGTSLGSGCTSGHGVCGIGRLSIRSIAATLTFLTAGIVATYIVRHLFGVQ